MLDLLNFKGKHKHKWDYLRDILLERVVYDDHVHRVWHSDDSMERGLVFAVKQVCKSGCVRAGAPLPSCVPACVRVCVCAHTSVGSHICASGAGAQSLKRGDETDQ